MADMRLHEQATELVSVLPAVWRRLFALEPEDPAMYLPGAQLRVCGILRDGPRTMSALSAELGISHSATTQIADRLERANMVERVPEADDRRVKTLQLTPGGEQMMRGRAERRISHVEEVLDRLSPEARESVLHALRVLLEAGVAVVPETLYEPVADRVTNR